MAEMKKKIQLVEGERKAVFEDCESEKAANKEKIKKLKGEVKKLQVILSGPKHLKFMVKLFSTFCKAELQTTVKSAEKVGKKPTEKDNFVIKKKPGEVAVEVTDCILDFPFKKLIKMILIF